MTLTRVVSNAGTAHWLKAPTADAENDKKVKTACGRLVVIDGNRARESCGMCELIVGVKPGKG